MKKSELMKKTEIIPVCVYRNPEHEETTKRELVQAQEALQSVLDVWNGLDLVPITDIFQLIMNPSKIYSEAIDKLAVVPVQAGRFQVSKEAYINTLDIPIPDSLYQSAKAARQQSFCAIPGLWSIEGSKVDLNESEALNYVNAMNIYTDDPGKINLAKDISKLCDLLNSLNKRCNNEILPLSPWTYNFFRGKFELKESGNCWTVSPKIETLKKWIQI